MADITLLADDAFSVSNLTAAINEESKVPGRISSQGLFDEEGISTTTVQIEKDGDTLSLVPAGVRGQPGVVVEGSKRKLIPFNTVHLPQRATISADEIQNVRAFGTESELEVMQTKVSKRLRKMRLQLDATHEWHRMGAIKGMILDADGTTPLLDIYQTFGIQKQTLPFELSNQAIELRLKCTDVLDMIEDALGNASFSGAHVYCGAEFWRKFITHKAVKETYLNTQMASALRQDAREAVEFGGCIFERYRGKVGKIKFVDDNKAHAVPTGAPELFISRYAPADYVETVNTEGLPYYAKQEPMEFGKGIKLEAQSNPLHLCVRPQAIIELEL